MNFNYIKIKSYNVASFQKSNFSKMVPWLMMLLVGGLCVCPTSHSFSSLQSPYHRGGPLPPGGGAPHPVRHAQLKLPQRYNPRPTESFRESRRCRPCHTGVTGQVWRTREKESPWGVRKDAGHSCPSPLAHPFLMFSFVVTPACTGCCTKYCVFFP